MDIKKVQKIKINRGYVRQDGETYTRDQIIDRDKDADAFEALTRSTGNIGDPDEKGEENKALLIEQLIGQKSRSQLKAEEEVEKVSDPIEEDQKKQAEKARAKADAAEKAKAEEAEKAKAEKEEDKNSDKKSKGGRKSKGGKKG